MRQIEHGEVQERVAADHHGLQHVAAANADVVAGLGVHFRGGLREAVEADGDVLQATQIGQDEVLDVSETVVANAQLAEEGQS